MPDNVVCLLWLVDSPDCPQLQPTGSRYDLLGFTLNAYFLSSPPLGPGRKAMCRCRYHEQFFFYKPKAHPLIFKIYFLQKL
jgi:hypothetical protein